MPDSDDQTIKGLERTLFSLHPNAETIYKAIIALKSNNEIAVSGEKQEFPFTIRYSKTATATWKILFALMHLHKFSKASDIREKILHYEPSFKMGLSTPLTSLKEENRIVVIKPTGSRRDTYYGFNKWIDKDGNPKDNYMWDTPHVFME